MTTHDRKDLCRALCHELCRVGVADETHGGWGRQSSRQGLRQRRKTPVLGLAVDIFSG
jgi:hypothetical protein